MPRNRSTLLALILLPATLAAAPATAADRTAVQTTVQVTQGLGGAPDGPSAHPAISGDERFDRVLAFDSEATNLVPGDTNGETDVFVARNAYPDANASQVWTPAGIELISHGLGGQPANGPSYGPAVDGRPGEPPVPPRCVAFVSEASNLVKGDTNRHADAFVYRLSSGKIERVSVDSQGHQANGRTFDVSIDGTCSRVAFSARSSRLGGGAHQQVYVHYLSGDERGQTVLASSTKHGKPGNGDSSQPSYSIRVSHANDKVAFTSEATNLGGPAGVFVHDFGHDRTLSIGAGGSDPAISEQGYVVAFRRGGEVLTNDRGSVSAITQPGEVATGRVSIGTGGAYVGYGTESGNVLLYTAVRALTLVESKDAAGNPLVPSSDPAVSARGNEVFFVHGGEVYARYLGPR
jgi:hypothetical protein